MKVKTCKCGKATEFPESGGSIVADAKATGWLPILGFAGKVHWYCASCKAVIIPLVGTLLDFLGTDDAHLAGLRKYVEQHEESFARRHLPPQEDQSCPGK